MPLMPLDSGSSRWALMRRPGDGEWFTRYWLIWTVEAQISAALNVVVILTISLRRQLRAQPFNKFIIGLCLPDFIFSFTCAIICLLHIAHGEWFGGEAMCGIQAVIATYGFAASMWMNVVIALELHRLARSTAGRPYRPPAHRSCVRRIALVHLGSLLLGFLPLIPGLPADVGLHRGLACLPMEYDVPSAIFHWALTMMLMLVTPLVLVLLFFKRAYTALLRSANGWKAGAAEREIFIFFLQLLLVFVSMWLPMGILIWIIVPNAPDVSMHMGFWGGFLSHFHGIVSAGLYMRKRDIYEELKASLSRGALANPCSMARSLDLRERSFTSEEKLQVQESMASLCQDFLGVISAKERTPMLVIEYSSWMEHGHLPRSSEGCTRMRGAQDVVIFISHRWWSSRSPDDPDSTKYSSLCRALRKLAAKHRLDPSRIVIWCDWTCIEQDDPRLKTAGIESLLSYVAQSSYMLIPVAPDAEHVQAFCTASHPMHLHGYGERAWCRLEVFIFMSACELAQRPPTCYAFGPTWAAEGFCMPRLERLRPLAPAAVDGGATFDLSKLPSTGILTEEIDREFICKVEDEMRDIYVLKAILAEKVRLNTLTRLQECQLRGKQIRCMDVPVLAREIFANPLCAGRLVALHLEDNLIGADGAAYLMSSIVCRSHGRGLVTLGLSNNPLLGMAGLRHLAAGLAHPSCYLATLELSACDFGSDALSRMAEGISTSSRLRLLDVSHNKMEDDCCDRLLEAAGGLDKPTLMLDVEGNPLSQSCIGRVARARVSWELGAAGLAFRSKRQPEAQC